jgi:hypothetical protein
MQARMSLALNSAGLRLEIILSIYLKPNRQLSDPYKKCPICNEVDPGSCRYSI